MKYKFYFLDLEADVCVEASKMTQAAQTGPTDTIHIGIYPQAHAIRAQRHDGCVALSIISDVPNYLATVAMDPASPIEEIRDMVASFVEFTDSMIAKAAAAEAAVKEIMR
jgi:hypothetical protein